MTQNAQVELLLAALRVRGHEYVLKDSELPRRMHASLGDEVYCDYISRPAFGLTVRLPRADRAEQMLAAHPADVTETFQRAAERFERAATPIAYSR